MLSFEQALEGSDALGLDDDALNLFRGGNARRLLDVAGQKRHRGSGPSSDHWESDSATR